MIALNPDGVHRHQDEWRVSPLDDPESNLRELTTALAQMTECDWRTPGCKKCQSAQISQGLACAEHDVVSHGTRRLLNTGPDDA